MLARGRLPPWLRRALEAGLVSGVVAGGALLSSGLGPGGEPRALPDGLTGLLVLAAPVLVLGVLAVSYPLTMTATRPDAVLGAIGAFLIGADIAVLAGGRLVLGAGDFEIAAGLFVAGLALGPAVIGLAAGQLLTPLGFGRRAGAWSAISAFLVGVLVLAMASRLA
ncbi:MAG TPA: hypothetical protein VIV06_01715 [Candidatus Limnocylindrales bacterium]